MGVFQTFSIQELEQKIAELQDQAPPSEIIGQWLMEAEIDRLRYPEAALILLRNAVGQQCSKVQQGISDFLLEKSKKEDPPGHIMGMLRRKSLELPASSRLNDAIHVIVKRIEAAGLATKS